jgi:hypothetical protein
MTGGPLKKKKLTGPKPVPVGSFMLRRVFRQGEGYFCGICRQKHASVEEANHCLEACWKTVLHRAPWSPVKRVGKMEFACIYCQRGYATSELATICAEECASRMSIAGLEGRDLSPTRVKRTFAKQDFKIAVNFPFSRPGHPVDHKIDVPADTGLASVDEAKADVTKASEEAEAAKKKKKGPSKEDEEKEKVVRDRTKKFERKGSKYECVSCHKLYFEKVEVERCFDSHSGGSMEKHQNSGV